MGPTEAHAANAPVGSRQRTTNSRPNSYYSSAHPEGASALEQGQGPNLDSSPLSQSLDKQEYSYDASHHNNAAIPDGHLHVTGAELRRSTSQMSQSQTLMPSKGGTLKKKASLRMTGSVKRSGSRRSSRAGSVRSLSLGDKEKYGEGEEFNSAFYTPVPTAGSPTDILANRFQAWRRVLKDMISYFRDIQKSYDVRSKGLIAASNVINNFTLPPEFLSTGGVGDATYILQDFHKQAVSESSKAREMEQEIIMQLTGLRSDLQQKIKEIKGLSGDFKNSVDKETEATRKAVRHLQEALGLVDTDPAATAGKGDPFIVKLAVDRQIERQIEEENYLHRAYLNLESSGRELESIVVGEIQKAYAAYGGILKREADHAFGTAERLREGPLAMAKDHEWDVFVTTNDHMVDPRAPVRSVDHITYPGKDHPAAAEVRSGMLERKSKYLKNYTPGWYVLSPTHLHEFKSADGIASQAPIMSLYLPEQKLGSHSEPGSSSHKFMLKGRQTGGMHRGHAWVFRAESYDTMMAWFADIRELTQKSGKERDAFVRRTHARSLSGGSTKAHSIGGSSDGGLEEDEADAQPYSSEQSVRGTSALGQAGAQGADGQHGVFAQADKGTYDYEDGLETVSWRHSQRPSPGGRFPSDLNVDRGLQAPLSPSSGESSTERDRDTIAAAGALPGSAMPFTQSEVPQQDPAQPANEKPIPGTEQHAYQNEPGRAHAHPQQRSNFTPQEDDRSEFFYPQENMTHSQPQYTHFGQESGQMPSQSTADLHGVEDQRAYIAPTTGTAFGVAAAEPAATMYSGQQPQHDWPQQPQELVRESVSKEVDPESAVPMTGVSSVPSVPLTAYAATTMSALAPTNTAPQPLPSSQGDTRDIRTIPTTFSGNEDGIESPQQMQRPNPPDQQPGAEVLTPEIAPGSDHGGVRLPSRPAPLRTRTSGTVTDLHIPGEFPNTPMAAQ